MDKNKINEIDNKLLKNISNPDNFEKGAYSIRKNGKGIEKNSTENINIVQKKDKSGLDFYIKEDKIRILTHSCYNN